MSSPEPALGSGLDTGAELAGAAPDRVQSVALASNPGADLAGRVALALRWPSPDPASVSRWLGLVERSQLPSDRREALAERLRSDLALAERVSAALAAALGRDTEQDRSELVRAFDQAASSVGEGAAPSRAVAEAVSAATGHDPARVEALCASLASWFAWWEEEEEEALPGDYAAEESGA